MSRRLHATHTGGCGRWRGLGTTLRGGIVTYRPWWPVNGVSVRQRSATRRPSSHMSRFSSGSIMNPPSSASDDDSPLPKSARPSERRSRVAIRSAIRAGWLNGGGVCTMPWPSRMRCVRCGDRGEEQLGRARVAVLLEEVVLDLPHVVDAEPVGELALLERLLQQLVLGVVAPRTRELVLVEDPELHDPRLGPADRDAPRDAPPGALL